MPAPIKGRAAIGHLLRRAGFGPEASTWSSWEDLSFDEAVERVLAELDAPPAADPEGFEPFEPGAIQGLWLRRMVRAPADPAYAGLGEKLALFWHGHFATSDTKIQSPILMWTQYKMLRAKGSGPFRDLVQAIAKDVAMVRWLDGNANRKGHANENFGRELQELFTLGIGNYTEHDIREVSRAFTGWGSQHYEFVFRPHFHDEGQKTFHGRTGNLDGSDAVDILVHLPACSRHIATKLLRFFSHADPSTQQVEDLAQVMRDQKLDIRATLAALFRAPAFRDPTNYRALVRSPVEFVVGSLRCVGSTPQGISMQSALDGMGQILFRPPSVKGWTSGRGWLSSSAIVERLRFAQDLANSLSESGRKSAAENLLAVSLQGDIPETLAESLRSLEGLELIATVLASPEFQLC